MLTSALVETVRDFKTRLPHCKFCPKTPKLRLENNALRGIRTPPLHLPPPFKCLLSTPPPCSPQTHSRVQRRRQERRQGAKLEVR